MPPISLVAWHWTIKMHNGNFLLCEALDMKIINFIVHNKMFDDGHTANINEFLQHVTDISKLQ